SPSVPQSPIPPLRCRAQTHPPIAHSFPRANTCDSRDRIRPPSNPRESSFPLEPQATPLSSESQTQSPERGEPETHPAASDSPTQQPQSHRAAPPRRSHKEDHRP